jgi:cyclopropane fatty-acyl-phospholipid synthase-like methyltransferase
MAIDLSRSLRLNDHESSAMNETNVQFWKELQDEGYFENHPCYQGIKVFGGQESVLAIEHFLPLRPEMKVVVIGCGYGRETLTIGPRASHVFGIDVNTAILSKAVRFLNSNGVANFTPVPVDNYRKLIPVGIDLVFSIVVTQHLTRNLVFDYFSTLAQKLVPGGAFVVQFLEELFDGVDERDAEMRKYEPSVSWTSRQISDLVQRAGLELGEIRTLQVTPTALWHWVYCKRPI